MFALNRFHDKVPTYMYKECHVRALEVERKNVVESGQQGDKERMADSEATSSSTSAFVSALIIYGVIGLIFVWLFLYLRPKNPRVYQPRTLPDIVTLPDNERTEEVPAGYFAWLPFLLRKSHSYMIHHVGLDAYLFLRYLSVFFSVSLLGCIILFPILLPVNATNGYDLEGFELLSFSNVENKNRFYAHVFLSWIYFGFIIFIIYRELYYYVVLRHAVQTSPLYDGLLSSRTLILTDISGDIETEAELSKKFWQVSNVSIARSLSDLQDLVKERSKYAKKYENTLNKVIRKSVKMKIKADKKDEPIGMQEESTAELPLDDLDSYIPKKKRPKHRLCKIPVISKFYGEKVDALDYFVEHIGELNDKILVEQKRWENNDKIGTAFIEFNTQLDAQEAFQAVPYLLKSSEYNEALVGYGPDDVRWSNISLTKHGKKMKRTGGNTILTLMIIFWAIPVAVVGCISNINFLIDKVPFLDFILNCPDVILGLITGILPTVALSILMSIVPVFIKKVANISGSMTRQETELYCHAWYYAFQVVQVFLVVTAASAASSTVVDIIDDPSSAMTLLAENLPKASNFYIAYFLLQGLSVPSGSLLQIVTLILSKFLGRILDKTPRQKWNRYNTIAQPSWGVVYPVLELLVCILITYSIIAPIILVFSTMALGFFYLAYLYNLSYVQRFSFDLRGRNYPRALFQVFVGLYLAEVCLIGLFIMAKSWGPVVLEAVCLAVTVLAHLYFKRRFIPLFDAVPISAIKYSRGEINIDYPFKDQGWDEIRGEGKRVANELQSKETTEPRKAISTAEKRHINSLSHNEHPEAGEWKSNPDNGYISNKSKNNDSALTDEDDADTHKITLKSLHSSNERSKDDSSLADVSNNTDRGKILNDIEGHSVKDGCDQLSLPPDLLSPKTMKRRIKYFFKPQKYYEFITIREMLPHILNNTVKYDDAFLETAYSDPCVRDPTPIIWCAKDPMGISQQQRSLAIDRGVDLSDDFSGYDEKGRAFYTGPPPDFESETKL